MGTNCKPKCWSIIPLVLIGIAALGYLVMVLWNWLMPSVFAGVREIDYVHALGVLVLSKILFGGFRGRGCHGRWHHHRLWQMTPEERERFQTGMRSCSGGEHKRDEASAPKEQHD